MTTKILICNQGPRTVVVTNTDKGVVQGSFPIHPNDHTVQYVHGEYTVTLREESNESKV